MLYYEILFFILFFIFMIVLLNTWIYYSFFFLKIDLIWWDEFNFNFKYIFINDIGFIKRIVLVVGQVKKK